GHPRPLAAGETSATGYLAWAPSPVIVFQAPGNRNLLVVDPRTESTRRLVDDESGFLFFPRPSPDGRSIAVNWNRRDQAGVWVISLNDGSRRYLGPGHP